MSSKGSLATKSYTSQSVDIAQDHSDFVMAFVAGGTLENPRAEVDFVVFIPGINRATQGDGLGQQYQSPDSAIGRGSDIIIVGRGIY
jgi:orotidine-5'-phosphate decarboxylase